MNRYGYEVIEGELWVIDRYIGKRIVRCLTIEEAKAHCRGLNR